MEIISALKEDGSQIASLLILLLISSVITVRIFKTADETEYHRHGVIKHPSKPLYPSKADLERLGLKAQGRSWKL